MEKYFRWFGLPGAVVLTSLLSAFALCRAAAAPTPVRFVCFAAMALSSVGDIFLAHLKSLNARFQNCFLIGAVFFMAAHLLYVLTYGMKLFHTAGALLWNTGTAIALLIGLTAFCLMLTLSIKSRRTKNLPLIAVYLFIILLNCSAVFTYAFAQGFSSLSAVCAATGVLSFLLSDLVIGLNLAGNIHRFDFLIWWLYPIGQVLLILGA
ncbi:MAG: hypothetical protein J6I98_07845 [Clostridia bacterium]|nr:hypothetical protein [Clostridia bacterium]